MKITIELTEQILSVLTSEQKTEILRKLIVEVKEEVDERIAKVKEELNHPKSNVEIVKEWNINNPSFQLKSIPIITNDKLMAEVIEKYKAGTSIAELAREYNINLSTLYSRIYRALGTPLKKNKTISQH